MRLSFSCGWSVFNDWPLLVSIMFPEPTTVEQALAFDESLRYESFPSSHPDIRAIRDGQALRSLKVSRPGDKPTEFVLTRSLRSQIKGLSGGVQVQYFDTESPQVIPTKVVSSDFAHFPLRPFFQGIRERLGEPLDSQHFPKHGIVVQFPKIPLPEYSLPNQFQVNWYPGLLLGFNSGSNATKYGFIPEMPFCSNQFHWFDRNLYHRQKVLWQFDIDRFIRSWLYGIDIKLDSFLRSTSERATLVDEVLAYSFACPKSDRLFFELLTRPEHTLLLQRPNAPRLSMLDVVNNVTYLLSPQNPRHKLLHLGQKQTWDISRRVPKILRKKYNRDDATVLRVAARIMDNRSYLDEHLDLFPREESFGLIAFHWVMVEFMNASKGQALVEFIQHSFLTEESIRQREHRLRLANPAGADQMDSDCIRNRLVDPQYNLHRLEALSRSIDAPYRLLYTQKTLKKIDRLIKVLRTIRRSKSSKDSEERQLKQWLGELEYFKKRVLTRKELSEEDLDRLKTLGKEIQESLDYIFLQ